MKTIKINFANPVAAKHFQSWLCGQGEQDYWTWMECREEEEKGNITVTNFDYDHEDLTIDTTCSRLDKE